MDLEKMRQQREAERRVEGLHALMTPVFRWMAEHEVQSIVIEPSSPGPGWDAQVTFEKGNGNF